MKIVYCSDLHLEFDDISKKKFESGNVLVLAGDIVVASYLNPNLGDNKSNVIKRKFAKLITNVFPNYDKVMFVLGNHEHYSGVFSDTASLVTDFVKANQKTDNFILLNRNAFFHSGINFIGATLWTDFNGNNELSKLQCAQGMADYRAIYQKKYCDLSYTEIHSSVDHYHINPDFILQQHNLDLAFIKEQLKINQGPTIVITHHAPSYLSQIPERTSSLIGGAFYCNLDGLIISNPHIQYWFYGHTHDNVNYKIGNTSVITNQKGYPGEKSFIKFNAKKSVLI